MNKPTVKQDQEWEAESDAKTMQLMGEIMSDAKRHERAKKKFDEMMVANEKAKKMIEMMNKSGMDYSKSMGGKK